MIPGIRLAISASTGSAETTQSETQTLTETRPRFDMRSTSFPNNACTTGTTTQTRFPVGTGIAYSPNTRPLGSFSVSHFFNINGGLEMARTHPH